MVVIGVRVTCDCLAHTELSQIVGRFSATIRQNCELIFRGLTIVILLHVIMSHDSQIHIFPTPLLYAPWSQLKVTRVEDLSRGHRWLIDKVHNPNSDLFTTLSSCMSIIVVDIKVNGKYPTVDDVCSKTTGSRQASDIHPWFYWHR